MLSSRGRWACAEREETCCQMGQRRAKSIGRVFWCSLHTLMADLGKYRSEKSVHGLTIPECPRLLIEGDVTRSSCITFCRRILKAALAGSCQHFLQTSHPASHRSMPPSSPQPRSSHVTRSISPNDTPLPPHCPIAVHEPHDLIISWGCGTTKNINN